MIVTKPGFYQTPFSHRRPHQTFNLSPISSPLTHSSKIINNLPVVTAEVFMFIEVFILFTSIKNQEDRRLFHM